MKTLDLLDQSLLSAHRTAVDPVVQAKFREAGAGDIAELLPHLEQRGQELAEGAVIALEKRAKQESEAMAGILIEQKKRVSQTAEKYTRDPQLRMDFALEEDRQLQSNQRHWEKRLADLDRELATEPARIRSVYEVKARRIEPIGLVYLWPVTG